LDYRKGGVKVTDLSSQMWCEKQLEFSLTKPRIRTPQMKKGEDIHKEKEEEIYEIVEVRPKTWEDRIILNLHNDITALEGLIENGVARELFMWGRFNSLKVVGVADELRTEDGGLVLSDTKTRQTPTMPRTAQQRPTRFQLMAYRQMFDDIAKGRYAADDLLRHYWQKADARASEDFVKQHRDLGQEFEPSMMKAAEKAFSLFKELPEVSKLVVSYEFQGDKSMIGKHEFDFNEGEFVEHVSFCEPFWKGERPAMGVGEPSRWKCSYCQYKESCVFMQAFLKNEG
jgi:exonuclease V